MMTNFIQVFFNEAAIKIKHLSRNLIGVLMEILFQGSQTSEEAAENILSVLRLFKDRYHIENFRDMRLQVILMDKKGNDMELVDSQSSEVYRTFKVYPKGYELKEQAKHPILHLVVDNT